MRSKKQKRSVEKTSPKQKELEKSVSLLRVELTRTEKALTKAKNRADRWQNEAKAQKKSASRARARVEKLRQKLDDASAARKPVQPAAPVEAVHPASPMETMSAGRPVAEATTVDAVTVPDETWSVVQLRAEARARGLTGMSNKTKAQLVAALS
jgi:lysophospholipase